MKIYRTWHAFLIEQLAEEESVSGYLDAVIEEYQVHKNLAIIQLALQYVVEAKGGISALAKKIDIEPHLLSEVSDSTKTPKIDPLSTVLNALGCQLSIAPLSSTNLQLEDTTEDSSVASPELVTSNPKLDEHHVSTEEG
ncbi:hypothetical protein C6503_07260 [Candidatus Poribacteria bacterium]|nr:MAG: hypothetical protein C6503_07260 [Candidatus Poribacteria bacterium]